MDNESEILKKLEYFKKRVEYLQANINNLSNFGKWDLKYCQNAIKSIKKEYNIN